MILSAMMFALGAFVSGLLWLALAVALVRRAKRLTERRLLASIASRRTEFAAERDEMRARHAVELYRLDREVSRVLDMATAHRLEADVRDRDLVGARAELAAREEDLRDITEDVTAQRDLLQEVERRHAEAGAALRALQHSLKLESRRRAIAEEALDEATMLGDQRRLELSALRAQNDAMRAVLGDNLPFAEESPAESGLPRIELAPEPPAAAPLSPAEPTQGGGSVVPLPTRRPVSADPAEQSESLVAEATRDLQRLAGEGHADFAKGFWRAPAMAEPRMPVASTLAEPSVVADLDAHRGLAAAAAESAVGPNADEDTETRFFEALAEIRALKRAASQAGE